MAYRKTFDKSRTLVGNEIVLVSLLFFFQSIEARC